MYNVLIVGGDFDSEGGRPSGIVQKIYGLLNQREDIKPLLFNGGYFTDLSYILETHVPIQDFVLWFANVPNSYPKYRGVKEHNPNTILISSKRNAEQNYSFQFLVNHALSLKSNLLLEFKPGIKQTYMRLLDPLGVVWHDYSTDIPSVLDALMSRAIELSKFTRLGSTQSEGSYDVPNRQEFFGVVKDLATTFHGLINPDDSVTRFLGNASFKGFRCERGFPSFKDGNMIYMSQRNVDKRYIGQEGFVAMPAHVPAVSYYGERKPSVDAPIQLSLYNYYYDVEYMVHSHVYIKDAPFTTKPIPCGALEEFYEIIDLVPKRSRVNFSVNLLGHGSLVLCDYPGYIKSIEYYSRLAPEIL